MQNLIINKNFREIKNVIGYLYGKEEPNDYIMLGNHYDDELINLNSGTFVLTEVARVFLQIFHQFNWRPIRTLVFCYWNSNEYGKIIKILMNKIIL